MSKMSRAVAVAASSRAAAAESSMASSARKTTTTKKYTMDSSGNVSQESHTHVEGSSSAESSMMKKMEERIAILCDDLDSEQSLRRRIEKEKQDLQMQIIALSERVTDAEGGCETQLDINRKREAEMAKLRKLLEDLHRESEETIHTLRTKFQSSMMELQEQIESVSKSKETVVKTSTKMKVEIQELYAQIEVLSQEKVCIKKVIERMEISIHEYNIKIEDMNRGLTDMTAAKSRLHTEKQESDKQLLQLKASIEHAGLDKNKIVSQLKDLQAALDEASRAKIQAETRLAAMEHNLKTILVELEDNKQMRLELERQVAKWREEGGEWKKKYENEARLRVEDVDLLKKKFGVQVVALQDQLDAMIRKLKDMELQKNKLAGEVQVLLKDLQISEINVKELSVQFKVSEKRCEELAIKLKETTNLYEKADKDSKVKGADLLRLANEMDRLRMDNDVMRRDNGKLQDDNRAFKADTDGLKKHVHELETENRKLAHDREELARAYKDADGGKVKALAKVQELEALLQKLQIEADKQIHAVGDESIAIQKKLKIEIESLTIRLRETEARLANEVEKIKQKMAVTIRELEVSLDGVSKQNVGLQNSAKQQSAKIVELISAYETSQKKLASVTQDYQIIVQKITIVDKELSTVKINLANALNVGKVSEVKVSELTTRLTELTMLTNNLGGIKAKLETDLKAVAADYDDIARELKLADDRANKAGADAQHFQGLLREENMKIVKVENEKKALAKEVYSLSVRIEEIETSSLMTSKSTIKKMELRIEELETMLKKEKVMHIETVTCLHKKEQSVKALLLQSEEDRKNILILQESLDKLNEKIKMYKRQLEEQESISNSNIMRVKKFQRELESAEARAADAESNVEGFRSRQRVFAAASTRKEQVSDEVERQIVVKKTVTNIGASGSASAMTTAQTTSTSSSTEAATKQEASQASRYSVARDYRAGSTYSSARAGSMARASSMARATSVGRSTSAFRY